MVIEFMALATCRGASLNPAKLLIDPCARQIDGEFKDNPLLHAGHNEPDYRDNAAIAPKCVVVIDHYDWEDDAPPHAVGQHHHL